MDKKVAVALADASNPYEQALASAARDAARAYGLELLPPHFAGGSAVEQMGGLFAFQRQQVDGYLLLAVAPDRIAAAAEGLLRSGASIAFLNRLPAGLDALSAGYPDVAVCGIVPHQLQIGRLQGEQCRRLAPEKGFVLLVKGTEETVSTVERRRGFLTAVRPHVTVHELEGRWTASVATEALARWFKLGAERQRKVDVIVCQNDAMAAGVRRALEEEAARSGRAELIGIPVTGVDGVPEDGERRVREGSLAATVKMPLTTKPAIAALADFWTRGLRAPLTVLEAESYPALERLGRTSAVTRSKVD